MARRNAAGGPLAEVFAWLQHLLGSVLALFYELIPSFGVSIILLTIAINLVLFPLTLRQTRSTRAFQRIQPELKRLQKELKDDKENLQRELMRVQKEAGATPSGCLVPMLIQLPIWFALFRVFRNVALIAHGTTGVVPVIPSDSALMRAISAGDTGFLGLELGTTMSDGIGLGTSGALPYVLILVLMVAAQYAQQWYAQMPAASKDTGSGGGQQVVTRIMPLFIGFISWRFPAGLVLYWTTSNLVRLGQQSLIQRLDGGPEQQPNLTEPIEKSPGAQTQGSKRAQPASKKKHQRRRRRS